MFTSLLLVVSLIEVGLWPSPPSPPVSKPHGPIPDFEYREGEWLEGFCARTRIDEWGLGTDSHDHSGAAHFYDLMIEYPDREVKINCEHKTIDIESKGSEREVR